MEKLLKTFSGISKKFDKYKEDTIKLIDMELQEYRILIGKQILEENEKLNAIKLKNLQDFYSEKAVEDAELAQIKATIETSNYDLHTSNSESLIEAKDKEIERLNQIIISMNKQTNIINK
jgi:hypothetical protein